MRSATAPESWHADRDRCRGAGIPDDVVYRPKTQIALELYDRAVAHGVRFGWLTFDEWYGGKPHFLRALHARGQTFVAEIPRIFTAWINPPRVTTRPFRPSGLGRPRTTPRMVAGGGKARTVEQLAQSHPALAAQRWQTWRIKDTHKGALVWHVKHALVWIKDEAGHPDGPYHLLVCYHPLTGEIKYFLSNAPPETPRAKLLRVAFGRWPIERCFEDGKGEIGLDHWEGRRWLGLKRHLILTSVSYLFLATTCQRLREKNPEWTVCQVRIAVDAVIQSWQLEPPARERLFQRTAQRIEYYQDRNALARACHRRTTLRKLHRHGITLTNLRRCDEDTS